MAWLGRKTLAFIPLSRTNAQPPDIIPTDWANKIFQRLFFDKDPVTGTDRSVRAYIHTVSSGLADLDVVVQLPETIAGQDIRPDALEATKGNLLRANGFDGAAIVMLGGAGFASSLGYWSRFCESDDLGAWVGELVHQTKLCNLPDLFDNTDEFPTQNMLGFDQEAGYRATHFSAWTKRAIGWVDPSTIPLHLGREAVYTLHSISLIQPPPAGRVAALQIGKQAPYLMVEARLRADQFDINIPSEGVIVYRVQTTDPLGNAQNGLPPLNLLTKTALGAGESFTADNGVTVHVSSSVPGGFQISITDPNGMALVPDVSNELEANASHALSVAGFVPKLHIPPKYAGVPLAKLRVQSQSPLGNTTAALGSPVTLTLIGGTIEER